MAAITNPKEPSKDCALCPRLAAHRNSISEIYPSYFNAPVPAFGALDSELLIVGLAPGLHGANRTGRPFTGDYAGNLLYKAMLHYGFAEGHYDQRVDDGLTLVNARIINAVRCLPPENKPTGVEVTTCRPFLEDEIEAMVNLCVILNLGTVAHGSVIRAFGLRAAQYPFAHGRWASCTPIDRRTGKERETLKVMSSYHCSRYNTNTGRLTEAMFMDIFQQIADSLHT